MLNELELNFLRDSLHKCRVKTWVITQAELEKGPDEAGQQDRAKMLMYYLKNVQSATLYRFNDPQKLSYLFLMLDEERILVIGPYLTWTVEQEQLLEVAERLKLGPEELRMMEQFCAALPKLDGNSPVFSMVAVFCERLWGESYGSIDIDQEMETDRSLLVMEDMAVVMEDPQMAMRMMEQRYAYENELMRAVSLGLSHKAEQILASLSTTAMERRTADPVRNLKNYCIIMNTLLRKAAEDGGVHPIYLDRVSSGFARRIEALSSTVEVEKLMREMFFAYCRLVKKNSVKEYSPPVQRTIVQIDADLAGDLSLKHLAQLQNINASYLSTLFKRETGQTVTDFVNQRRIQLARQLLSTTQLQVQTIARYCGIPDVNYFSKIFKKHTGQTPKEYRRSTNSKS